MNNYIIKLKTGASVSAFGSWYEFNKKDGILSVVAYDESSDAEDLTFSTDLDNVEYIICTAVNKVEIIDRI